MMTAGKGHTRDSLFKPRQTGILSRLSWLDKRPPAWVKCHGCQTDMLIEMVPARDQDIRKTFYPCPQAPYICAACREDREKLREARKAMVEHFHSCGSKETEDWGRETEASVLRHPSPVGGNRHEISQTL